ncbi:uncharacterized protein LOC144445501 [Glandiceps talaboti]
MALTALPFTYSKFPLKILNKGPEYFKLQAENREQKCRKTATELLAESRHRYVKTTSAENQYSGHIEYHDSCKKELPSEKNEYETIVFRPFPQQGLNSEAINQATRTHNVTRNHDIEVKPPVPRKPNYLFQSKRHRQGIHSRDGSFDSGVYPNSGPNHLRSSSLLQTSTQETQTNFPISDPLNGNRPSQILRTHNGLKIHHVKSKSAPVSNSYHVSKMVNLFNKLGDDDIPNATEHMTKDNRQAYHNSARQISDGYDSNQNSLRPKSPCARRCDRRHHTVSGGEALIQHTDHKDYNESNQHKTRPKPCSYSDQEALTQDIEKKNKRQPLQEHFQNEIENMNFSQSPELENHESQHFGLENDPKSSRQDQSQTVGTKYKYDTFPKSPRASKHPFSNLRRDSLTRSPKIARRNWCHEDDNGNRVSPNIDRQDYPEFRPRQNSDARSLNALRREHLPEGSEGKAVYTEKVIQGSDLPSKSPIAQRRGAKLGMMNVSPTRRMDLQKSPRNDRKSPLESQLLSLLLTEFEYKREVDGKATPISDAGFDSKGDSLKWSSTYQSEKSIDDNHGNNSTGIYQGDNVHTGAVEMKVERIVQPQYETHISPVRHYHKYYQSEVNLLDRVVAPITYASMNRVDLTNQRYYDEVDGNNSQHSTGSSFRRRLQRSKSDISHRFSKSSFGSDPDRFFNEMGMDYSTFANPTWERVEEIFHMMHGPRDRSSVSGDSHWGELSWRSDQSTKGPFRMGIPDRLPDTSQSVVMRNARIIKWLTECRKARSRSLSIC